jgi:hypothetical protein
LTAAGLLLATFSVAAVAQVHKTKVFTGAKVNAGMVTHEMKNGRHMLTLSDDFKTPDTPDPHWQVVDSKGQSYLLQRLMIKGDKMNKTIELPPYVYDVAKVQIWCAWAETVLGETSFDPPIR